MDVSLVDSAQAFADLQGDWDELVAASEEDNPFRRWFWNYCWWKHFGRDRQLAMVAVRESGKLVALAPWFIERDHWWRGARVVRFLGATDEVCAEHLGLLIQRGREEALAPVLLEYFCREHARRWDVLRLTDVPAHSAQVPALEAFALGRRLTYRLRPDHLCRLVRFPDSWERYLQSLPSKRRTKLRRIEREWNSQPHMTLAVAESPADLPPRWDELRRLHNIHWATQGMQGCFEVPAFDAFHSELIEYYLPQGMLLLATLHAHGQPITSSYSLRLGETVYEYQRGHDPQWLAQRPGHALQFMLFRYAVERGVRCWDYLRGDYAHKRDWSNDVRESVELQVASPRTVQVARFRMEGRLVQAKDQLRHLRESARHWRASDHDENADSQQPSTPS